ncbi:MAG: prephenate dehydratase domain-containing protein [Acidimicrobiia bacterium]|nr:prephenate dehydratase domain-containing protein [Acidimicrobiia bacterium]
MRIGFQGEPHSYSFGAARELFPQGELIGYATFAATFDALEHDEIDRLVVPVENSTTGSVLPVLDRLPGDARHVRFSILAEHLVEVRHTLHGLPGATLDQIREVRSHPQALAQAEYALLELGVDEVPTHDTAGAVRQVAEGGDPTVAALAPPSAGAAHGLEVILDNVLDRDHNTTRFVVLHVGEPEVNDDDDKTTIVVTGSHTPGSLALILTELGLRGANLTRIESRPAGVAWNYRFFIDLVHEPGAAGLKKVLDPPPANAAEVLNLGSYKAVVS